MSQDHNSSQNKTCNGAAVQVVSPDDFQRALEEIDVEEVRRCLEIDRFLVDKPIVCFGSWGVCGEYPPLVYALEKHKFSESDRRVLELVQLVRVLLDHKADINAKDADDECTALHNAVEYNLVEVVELLLQYQPQVDARNYCGRTPLFYAKTVEVARLLIAYGADVNSKDDYGTTPLFYAENVEMAQLLIANGAGVNSKGELGDTPLGCAENVEVAQLLIANGADVNSKNDDGYPAWFSVMQRPWDLEALKVLLEHGADLQGEGGIQALYRATEYGTLEFMEFLLDQGIPVNARATVDGETPLHCAMRRGWAQGVQLLLRRGADANATNHHGKTPFAYIASFYEAGIKEVAELLVEYVVEEGKNFATILNHVHPQLRRYMMELIVKHPKVDLNARVSADGDALAFHMIDKFRQDMIDVERPIFMLLIEYGADVKAKHQKSGRTLLHFAAAGSNLMESCYYEDDFHSEVQLLLEKGADVNAIDYNGFTPLLHALYHGHWKNVQILVDHRADVNIAHKDHGTPLLMACARKEESTMQLLLDAGAQVDARLKDGATALLICVRKGLVGCATILLNRGADIHAANRKGCTPFLEACRRRRLDVIYRLIRSSSHHGRLGLLSDVSYPSFAWSTTAVIECEDGCDGLVNLFCDDSDADAVSGGLDY